ncbi:MAG: glycosyltransferase family 4 protein [bacterium]|nr:glycosyltransferase family 4 protein [bacterium]
MRAQKKVLIITSTFPRSDTDHQVPWLGKLVQSINTSGFEVEVMVPAFKGSRSYSYHGIKVHRFRYAPTSLEFLTHEEGAVFKLRQKPWLYIIALSYMVFGCFEVIRLLRQTRYDVVHVQWPFPNGIFGILARYIGKCRLVLTFHGAGFILMRRVPFGKKIMHWIISCADVVIANSSFTKKQIVCIKSVPVEIIPFASAVLTQRLELSHSDSNIKRKFFKILFVGRLIERKGLIYLIRAVSKLVKSGKNVKLDIVGDGPLFSSLYKKVVSLDLDENILFHREVGENQLAGYYKSCDLFILPSIVDEWGDTEGLGVVLIEAMNFGKPVIASNVGGIGDIVKDGQNGILVTQKDVESLVDAIMEIIKHPRRAKQLGGAGRNMIQKHFDWQKIIKRSIDIYYT